MTPFYSQRRTPPAASILGCAVAEHGNSSNRFEPNDSEWARQVILETNALLIV